uniref:Microtubule-associated protein TORTIFOLIA1 n=1 Tax=Cajanus cajan TaxID=3821 RepID=A0A151T1M2_CAJCA|nr:Microtubule-associated protein TORTIFOLIA1 [Cajanus cajan]
MKHPKPQTPTPAPSSRSSSLSSHLAMVELKQRILTSLSKLSDRDTHQIAVEDLEKTIAALSPDNKGVQGGAAACMAKMVECAGGGGGGGEAPVAAFQKLCPRICKLLNSPNFMAKAAILPVVASLSQVGAIAPHSLEHLLPSIHECLTSTDWATRKAAAEALNSLALHSSSLVTDRTAPTLTVLEACRFDKIKPVRDSINEALQLWKKIAGKGDASPDDSKPSSDGGNEPAIMSETNDSKKVNPDERKTDPSVKDSSTKKAVVILKKKAPVLSDKELNPEFFQKLERRGSDDLPVEVVVPRRGLNSSNNEEESEANAKDSKERTNSVGNISSNDDFHGSSSNKYRIYTERRVSSKELRAKAYDTDDRTENDQRDGSANLAGFSKTDGQSEVPFSNNRGNWLAIQRQLLQLERQQVHLMNMLQDFMGGSHDSMVTLENRVRGLERIVEDMSRDLSISSGRRNFSGGRGPSWRSDMSEGWDLPGYGASRNGQISSRRGFGGSSADGRSPKSVHDNDQAGNRRAWDKAAMPIRLGEGPSARSVWQASKDEATLEAIRVAGEDNGTSRATRVAIPEMTAEALADDNVGQERDAIWTSWSNAMDALQVGDVDSAFAEVLSTGDDILLVKLMDRTGPVIDQLSSEVACEIVNAIGQFLLDQNMYDICLSWIQQLLEIVLENGPDTFSIPMEVKKELLLNLHEASTDTAEAWEGVQPDQLLLQMASAWEIDLQQHDK